MGDENGKRWWKREGDKKQVTPRRGRAREKERGTQPTVDGSFIEKERCIVKVPVESAIEREREREVRVKGYR